MIGGRLGCVPFVCPTMDNDTVGTVLSARGNSPRVVTGVPGNSGRRDGLAGVCNVRLMTRGDTLATDSNSAAMDFCIAVAFLLETGPSRRHYHRQHQHQHRIVATGTHCATSQATGTSASTVTSTPMSRQPVFSAATTRPVRSKGKRAVKGTGSPARLVWLSWLGIVPGTESLPVRFPVKAHTRL